MRVFVKVFLLLLVLSAGNAMAKTCTAKSGTNNWNSASSWAGCGVPDDGNAVNIPAGSTLRLDADTKQISNLTVEVGGVFLGSGGNKLDLRGPGNLTNNGTITLGDAKIEMNGDFVNTGTFNAGSDTLKFAGDFTNTGTFNAQTGKVEFDGNAAQTITGNVTFNDLKVDNGSNSGLVLSGNVIVNGELSGNAVSGGLVKLSDTCPVDYTLTSNNGNTVQHSCPPPPSPIAEYRFEETAGTVADSSGNGLNGSRSGVVTVGGSGKICNGYKFNGSNAFVSVPNSTLLNQSKITVMAWMRHSAASIKSWEAIVTKGDSAYRLHLYSGGACSINGVNTPGGLSLGINGGCAGADINSGTVPVAGTWYHAAGTYDGSTIKIYVNGTLSESRAYAGAINSNNFPLYIGENAQQTGRFFSGDIDEVKIYNSALTAAQISAGYANENAGKNWDGTARVCAATGPDHYELSLPTTGISCLPTTVTVTACATAAPCNPMTTLSGKTALLTTSAGALTATTVTFNASGVASTTLSYPAASDGAVATVTLSGEQVAAINARKYCPDGANCVVGNSSSTTFKTAGFIFATAADAVETTFSSQTAGVDFGPYWLRSVKTNTTTKTCEAAFTSPHPVNFSYQCLDPASCSSGSWLKVGSSSLGSSGASVNLSFDANGNASLGNFNFADVGQIKINVSAAAGGATLTGWTKEAVGSRFVVRPYSLVLTDIKQTASPSLANPAAVDAAGSKFVKAGESFSATVTSVNASCAASLGGYSLLSSIPATCITPNYGQEATRETVALSDALVPGLGLSANPALNNAAAFAAFSGGSATGNAFNWAEVGIIRLTPSVGDGNYLGAGNPGGTTSGNVGRFYPDHFDTSVTGPMTCTGLAFTSACPAGGLVYSGQPFTTNVYARNASGGTTSNYGGSAGSNGFAKAVTLSAVSGGGGAVISTGAVTTATASVAAAAFRSGSTESPGTPGAPIFRFTSSSTAPTNVFVRAEESSGGDAVSSLRAVAASSVEGGVKVVSGRIKVANGYGSELLPLPLDAAIQYYTGSAWATSATDSVTTLTLPANFPLTPSGTTAASMTPPPAAATLSGMVSSGKFKIYLARPAGLTVGAKSYASILPTAPLFLLTCNTASESNTGTPPCPSSGRTSLPGVATFGIFKSPLIYRRENY